MTHPTTKAPGQLCYSQTYLKRDFGEVDSGRPVEIAHRALGLSLVRLLASTPGLVLACEYQESVDDLWRIRDEVVVHHVVRVFPVTTRRVELLTAPRIKPEPHKPPTLWDRWKRYVDKTRASLGG